ncbi:hypothetical protein IG631_05581 [Alternaria alternata]|nr:hypothetical protein IG631_05581 [Alternaria alternata]
MSRGQEGIGRDERSRRCSRSPRAASRRATERQLLLLGSALIQTLRAGTAGCQDDEICDLW